MRVCSVVSSTTTRPNSRSSTSVSPTRTTLLRGARNPKLTAVPRDPPPAANLGGNDLAARDGEDALDLVPGGRRRPDPHPDGASGQHQRQPGERRGRRAAVWERPRRAGELVEIVGLGSQQARLALEDR